MSPLADGGPDVLSYHVAWTAASHRSRVRPGRFTSSMQAVTDEIISFGPHRLFPSQRVLLRDEAPVALRGRAMELLLVLVERAGEIVPLDELAERIWGGARVEEATIRVHIATLRRALDPETTPLPCIANIPGRGYSFVAPVSRTSPLSLQTTIASTAAQRTNLPARISSIVGRDEVIDALLRALAHHRLVTVVGSGGVGKTTVAVATAQAWARREGALTRFVDLAAIDHASLVPSALAEVLGVPVGSADPCPQILSMLKGKTALIVLDNCEHLVEAAASLAEVLLRGTTNTRVLATSREALRAEGESVHRLPALDYPAADAQSTVEHLMSFPSVSLFVERATAAQSNFHLDDVTAAAVADICRSLDGIALAIELAAGRVGTLGVAGIATLLSDQIGVLSQGRRTAIPRHRTLMATLNWSYRLLPDWDRTVFRRLSVFVGPFSMASASAVAADNGSAQPAVVDTIANLVAKCLVTASFEGGRTTYRLLETTRKYAQEMLGHADEARATSERHVRMVLSALSGPESEREERFGPLSQQLGNIRAALAWAFSQEHSKLASALAAAAATALLDLSLIAECNRWSTRALEQLEGADKGTRVEMELLTALAVTLPFTQGNRTDVADAWRQALALAEALDNTEFQLKLLEGLFVYHLRIAQFGEALNLADRSRALARRIPSAPPVDLEWMHGIVYHFMGLHSRATEHCGATLEKTARPRHANVVRFGVDPRLHAHCALARTEWLQGRWSSARRTCESALQEARSTGHPTSLCMALTWASAVPYWSGDLENAASQVEELQAIAEEHRLAPYQAIALGLQGEIALHLGEFQSALSLLEASLQALRQVRHEMLIGMFAGDRAMALSALGRHDAAKAAITEAVAMVTERAECLYLPELLRLEGAILAAEPGGRLQEAEDSLEKSLALAREQDAVACELRAMSTLVELRRRHAADDDGHDRLRSLVDRFADEPELADLRRARRLLAPAPTG